MTEYETSSAQQRALQERFPELLTDAALLQWLQAQPEAPSLARLSGATHGILATATSPADLERSPLALLGVETTQETARWGHALVQRLNELTEARADDPAATIPAMLDQTEFLEWMAGLGAVAMRQPEPLYAVISVGRQTRPTGRGRRAKSREASLRDLVGEIMTVMALTPPEYFPANFPPGAAELLAQSRQTYVTSTDWTSEGCREVALESLSALNTAYSAIHLLDHLDDATMFEDPGGETIRRQGRKIMPNEPCPCQSGKKYKKCHGAPGAAPLPS